jgi:hypothetical protein
VPITIASLSGVERSAAGIARRTNSSKAHDGKTLQATHVNAAPSSSELHPVETSLDAHLFARAVVTTCVVNGVRSRNVIAEEDGSAA